MTARTAIIFGIAAILGASPVAQSEELTDVKGAIEAVNPRAGWYAIVPDGDQGIRYAPDRLPDAFKKDGLRVVFSGRVGRVDPNVRTWGIPLTLTKIEREPFPLSLIPSRYPVRLRFSAGLFVQRSIRKRLH